MAVNHRGLALALSPLLMDGDGGWMGHGVGCELTDPACCLPMALHILVNTLGLTQVVFLLNKEDPGKSGAWGAFSSWNLWATDPCVTVSITHLSRASIFSYKKKIGLDSFLF